MVAVSDRDVVKKTYLEPREAAQLSRWADEAGKSESALLREAVLEYLDRDRTARIEERVGDIEGKLDRVLAAVETGDAHTHTADPPMNQSGSSAVEKARDIVRRLQANHDDVLKAETVERAIEDVAGIDDRTIRKYKRLFKRRGILFAHPGEPPLWTSDAATWLEWMQQYARLNGRDEAEAIADDYPATVSETLDGSIGIELAEVEGGL